MMIPADLLELLCCPRSGQPLALADNADLARANDQVPPADQQITEALVSADKRFLYPVRDGIPVLLTEEAISL